MPRPRNQRQLELLGDQYYPAPKRKNTYGNIIPVTRPRNPYISNTPDFAPETMSLASQLGAQRADENSRTRAPSLTPQATYDADPILARIKAIQSRNVGNARAEADAAKRQAFIDYGYGDVATELGADPNTISAAQANPFSIREMLARDTAERGRQVNENLNQGNLFYSGARVNQLEELARNRAQAEVNANRDLRDLLGQIDSSVLSAEQEAAMAEMEGIEAAAEQARADAANQALLDALAGDGGAVADPYSQFGMPEPIYEPPPLTPEEELMLLLGLGGNSAFTNYAF